MIGAIVSAIGWRGGVAIALAIVCGVLVWRLDAVTAERDAALVSVGEWKTQANAATAELFATTTEMQRQASQCQQSLASARARAKAEQQTMQRACEAMGRITGGNGTNADGRAVLGLPERAEP